jgi:hypothetical protein
MKDLELDYNPEDYTEEQKKKLLELNEAFTENLVTRKKESIENFFLNLGGTIVIGLLPGIWPLFFIPGILGLIESLRIGQIEKFIEFLKFENQKLKESLN